jgi:hypothetical protein
MFILVSAPFKPRNGIRAVVSGHCLQANQMSTSAKTDNLICSILTLDDNLSARHHSKYMKGQISK